MPTKLCYKTLIILLIASILFTSPGRATAAPDGATTAAETPGYWEDPLGDVPVAEADLLSGSITVTPDDFVDVRAQFASQPFTSLVHSMGWCLGLDQNPMADPSPCSVPGDISLLLSYSYQSGQYAFSIIDLVHGRKDLDACQYSWYDPATKTLRIKFPLAWLRDDGIFNYVASVDFGGSGGNNENAPDSPNLATPGGYFTSVRVDEEIPFAGTWLCSWPTLSASPASLNFTTTAGGMAPPAQPINITNTDHSASALGWSVSERISWLNLSKTTGMTPGSTYFSINSVGLGPGVYSGIAQITSDAAKSGSPQYVIPILEVLTASGEPPGDCPAKLAGKLRLGLEYHWYSYFGSTIFDPTDQMLFAFSILPPSLGSINISLGGRNSAYALTFNDGLVDGKYPYNPDQWNNVEVLYDFSTRQYTTTINGELAGTQSFQYPDANSVSSVNIVTGGAVTWIDAISIYRIAGSTRQPLFGATFDDGYTEDSYPTAATPPSALLSAPCADDPTTWSVTPQSLSFEVAQGQSAPPAQQIQIAKNGPAAATWALSESSLWLQTSSTAGTMPATIDVSVDPAGLEPGLYSVDIVITPAKVQGRKQIIPVTLVVKGPSTPPGSFNKSGPTGTNQPVTGLQISWTASVGAARYEYCIDEDTNATCESSWQPANSPVTLSERVYNTTYSYQVRALNGSQPPDIIEAKGGWVQFTTMPAPPAQTPPGYWTDPMGDVTAPEADLLSGSITITPDNNVDVRAQFASWPFTGVMSSMSWCLDLDQDLSGSDPECNKTDLNFSLTYNNMDGRHNLFFANPYTHVSSTFDACQYSWYDPASKTLRIKFPLAWLRDDGIFNYVASVAFGGSFGNNENAPNTQNFGSRSGYFSSARVDKAIPFSGSWLCSWPTQVASATQLNFTTKAGVTPLSQFVSIINTDHSAEVLNWSAKETMPWLSLSQTSGTTPGGTYFSINPSGLEAGVYFSETKITSPEAKDGSPKLVYSVLEVLSPTGEPPTDCPARLALMGALKQRFEPTQFGPTDKMLVSFSVLPASSGITDIYMNEATATERTGYSTIFQDGLVDGKYPYKPGQWNNVEILYDFSTHQYTMMINGTLAGTQPFEHVDTNSIGRINIFTETLSSWFDSISIYRITGSTRQLLFGATFDDGYFSQNTFQPPQAALSAPCSAQTAAWSVTPQSLTFEVAQGQSAPPAQQIQMVQDGPSIATWTISENTPWLQTDSTAGIMPAVVSVSVDPAGLVPGTYSGSFLLTPAGLKGQPHTVAVTLLVKEPSEPPGWFTKTGPFGNELPITGQQISWTASSGVTSYQFCYYTAPDTGCSESFWAAHTTTLPYVTLPALANETTYYWQVRAVNRKGAVMANDGIFWSFTTVSYSHLYLPIVTNTR